MSRSEVRCAVAGLGRLGQLHARNLAGRVAGARLVAVADSDKERARSLADELGVHRWSAVSEEVFALDDVDAVIIVTPTSTHVELAEQAARLGKPIFIEKPVSLDTDSSRHLMRVVDERGVLCQVGFMRRFDPDYRYARRLIADGHIGEPLYFKAVSRDPRAPPASFVAHSGGLFLDMAIHDFDIARYLLGMEVAEVTAMGSIVYSKDLADYGDIDQGLCYLRFEGGQTGDVEAYRNAFYGYDIRAEVLGTRGSVLVGGIRRHGVMLNQPGRSVADVLPTFAERFDVSYQAEMQAFVDCVRQDRLLEVGLADSLQALRISLAAQRSLERGQSVRLAAIE